MKPDDILRAIGDIDDAYIRKAHRKSLLRAILVFLIILILGGSIALSQLSDYHLLLRYNPDGTVLTGFIEPEAIIQKSWTSMEYTAYRNGAPAGTALFQRRFSPNYRITCTGNEKEILIVGSNGDESWPHDYLGTQHFANLYITAMYSCDLIDRIDGIYINSETAHGESSRQLNCVRLEYRERSQMVSRQFLIADSSTPEERVVRSRGYDYHNNRISGWKEWDSEGTLLVSATYRYDRNTQTVSSYLADGTLSGTRVSGYSFGKLRWREYYDADGILVGREMYRYRVWEPFICLEGLVYLLVILSLAATAAFAVWDDRIQFGTVVAFLPRGKASGDNAELIRRIHALNQSVDTLSARLAQARPDIHAEELSRLTEQISLLRGQLEEFLPSDPESK